MDVMTLVNSGAFAGLDLPVELLSAPNGILAVAMVSVIALFWRSHACLAKEVGITKGALRLAEGKDEKLGVLVDVIERNTEALAAIKAAVDSSTASVRGCPYGRGGA
jgi:hypothetical protein